MAPSVNWGQLTGHNGHNGHIRTSSGGISTLLHVSGQALASTHVLGSTIKHKQALMFSEER